MRLRDRVWLTLSQAVNAYCYDGDPDEALSARAYRKRNDGWAVMHARLDRWLGGGHCEAVWHNQRARELARLQ